MLQQWNTVPLGTDSSSVIVKNLSPATKEDTIIIHFQKRRNGGGEVESVRFLSEGVAVVTFETSQVADSVLTRSHEIDGVLVKLERYRQSCPDQVFGKVSGRLDPHNLGLSFSNMEAILQTIHDEAKVEWKKIFDGFVVSGTFEQIKKVHELLNDHLQKKKQHKESTQKYSSRPVVRDTFTIRQPTVGSKPSTGPTSFRTPTDSMTTIDVAEVPKYNKPLTLENSQVKGNKKYGNISQTEINFQEKLAISETRKTNEVCQPDITRDVPRLLPAKVTHISSTNNNGKKQDQLVTEPQSDVKHRPTAVTPSVKNQMALFEDDKEKGSKARHLKTEVVVDALPISRVSEVGNTSTTDGKIQVREESKQHGDVKDRQLAVRASNGKTNSGSEPKLQRLAAGLPKQNESCEDVQLALHASKGKTDRASEPKRQRLAAGIPKKNESCEDVQFKSTLINGNPTAEKSSSILTALDEACPQENDVCSYNETPKSAEVIKRSESSEDEGKYTMEGNYFNYITSTGITVMLLKGDITSQYVDVLLSPANPTLSHKEGLLKLIFEKGGQEIEDQCLRITQTHGPLEYGTTCFTSSGKLSCKVILHAVLPPWINENDDEKAYKLQIHRCLKDGLTLASGHRYRSVAFSPLGQDWNCIPLEVSAEVLTRVIAAFSKSVGPMHSGINDFRIVCEDDATIDAFVKEFTSFSLRDEKPFFVSAMSKNTLNDGDQIVKYQSAERHRKGYDQDVYSSIEKERSVEQMQKSNSSPKSDSLFDKESGEIPAGSPKIESASSSQLKSDSPESPAILHGISEANDDSLKNAKQCHESAVTFISSSCIERSNILETKALELLEVKETTVTGFEEETSKRITSQDNTKDDLKVCVMESNELTEGTAAKNAKMITPEIRQAELLQSFAHNEQNEDILGSEAHYSHGSVEDTASLHPLPTGQEKSVVFRSNLSSLRVDGSLLVTSPTVEALLNADLPLGLQGLQIEHDRSTKNNNKEDRDKGQESFLSLHEKKVNSDEISPIASCNLTSTDECNSNDKTEKHPEKDINEKMEAKMAPATADTDKDTKDEYEPAELVKNYHYGNRKVSTERQITFLCALCQDTVDHPELTDPTVCAEHKFCDDCILKAFTFSNNCPACVDAYGLITTQRGNNVEHNLTATKVLHQPVFRRSSSIDQEGNDPPSKASPDLLRANQPPGQMMWKKYEDSLPGYEGYGTIVVTYIFYDGFQSAEHPSPGESYTGMSCIAYFPDTQEGRHVLKLLHKAFDARLVFTVSKSASDGTGHVVINGIELKTTAKGDARNGYPDGGYLSRVKVQLAAKGIQ
ncbi:hypothetical protein ACROYT_G018653 [Oculina patagonica]